MAEPPLGIQAQQAARPELLARVLRLLEKMPKLGDQLDVPCAYDGDGSRHFNLKDAGIGVRRKVGERKPACR